MRSRVFGNSVPNNGCLPGWAGLAEKPNRAVAGRRVDCVRRRFVGCQRPLARAWRRKRRPRNRRMPSADAKEQEEKDLEKYTKGVIWSLYLGRDWVYALTPSGIYRVLRGEENGSIFPRRNGCRRSSCSRRSRSRCGKSTPIVPFPGSAATMRAFRQRARRWGYTVSIPATTNGRSCLRNTTLLTCTSRTTRQCFRS